VRGDENGRMHFLADIYRYDRQRVNERQLEINPAAIIPE
jgi:murein L,D-transpeptidase YcbB/YkuD